MFRIYFVNLWAFILHNLVCVRKGLLPNKIYFKIPNSEISRKNINIHILLLISLEDLYSPQSWVILSLIIQMHTLSCLFGWHFSNVELNLQTCYKQMPLYHCRKNGAIC